VWFGLGVLSVTESIHNILSKSRALNIMIIVYKRYSKWVINRSLFLLYSSVYHEIGYIGLN